MLKLNYVRQVSITVKLIDKIFNIATIVFDIIVLPELTFYGVDNWIKIYKK